MTVSAVNNAVEGNFIGTDAAGTARLPNMGNGLVIMIGGGAAGTTTVAGNVISGNNGDGVLLQGGSTSGVVLTANMIGTDVTGTFPVLNQSNGVHILDASNNTVGGTTAAARNIISGNTGDGVLVENNGGAPAANNIVEGNYIGTDVTGTVGLGTNGVTLGNTGSGVALTFATANTVGGSVAGAGNVVSNNVQSGVSISSSGFVGDNVVEGNFVGTDSTGAVALGNGSAGITITNSYANTIGGTTAGARNIVSGNVREGIFITAVGAPALPAQVQVLGNYVGTDVTGTKAVGNGLSGVSLLNAVGVTIGGTTTGAGNLISGNGNGTMPGVAIAGGSQRNLVEGNLIGSTATGGSLSPSNSIGIALNDSGRETIGGTAPGAGNTIAFNTSSGIFIFATAGRAATGTVIEGNTIVANGTFGVRLQAAGDTVGGTTAGARNLISSNATGGVAIQGSSSTGNLVEGNYIGTDVTGTIAVGNGASSSGVAMSNGASGNTIGGTVSGSGNLISGNAAAGVSISGARE